MGKIIVIIGIDGSGKSTFIKNLGFPSKHFFKSTATNSSSTVTVSKVHKAKASRFRILVGTILKIYIPNLLVFVRYKFFSKKVFVFDRYSYDFSGRLNNREGIHAKILNFLFYYFPTPDFVIFLNIEPSIAFARKNEFDIPFLTKKQSLLKQSICKVSDKKLFIIDPVRPVNVKEKSTFINELIAIGLKKI